MEKALDYSEVSLTPKYSELASRSKADVSAVLGNRRFRLPVIPANMAACIDDRQAKWLSEEGYFYIRHRFNKDERGKDDSFSFCCKAEEENWETISISIGVQPWDYILVENLSGSFGNIGYEGPTRCDYITIDIAHGHSKAMKDMIAYIHGMYKWEEKRPFIIAGNVTTPQAVRDLADWGADAVKVGIGGGGACSTKNQTGFHIPMFTAVQKCAGNKLPRHVPIIADGGIRENGHIAKALVAGADWVMAGSIFAACKDSPAESVRELKMDNGVYSSPIVRKKYFGSASAKNKGANKHVEGLEIEIPCNGMTYAEKLTQIKENLQSAVSYAGGVDLSALKKVEVVEKSS